jgi:hypothetical protein
MRTRLHLVIKLSALLGIAFAVVLLLLALGHPAGARQRGNENTDSNPNANRGANTDPNANKPPANNGQTGNGNQPSSPGSGATRSTVPCPSPEAFNEVKVTNVYKSGTATDTAPKGNKDVELGDEITLEVDQLKTLLDRATCATPRKNVVLFLAGRPLKDVTPFPPTDPAKTTLKFPLKRTEKSRDVWTYLLGKPRFQPNETEVSVGLEDEYPVPSAAAPLNLQTIPIRWFIFWLLVFLVLLAAFLLLAKKTNLLRDEGPEPGADDRKPYSLARTQAAWWFFIVLASYLFIGIITGDFSTTITGTVLTLLGISAGTVVGSVFVDASKPPANPPALTSPPPATPPAVRGTPTWKNEWWWVDILSDANGVSFHRFQMAAWTLVLGVIFVVQVYNELAMPQFNGTLLGLLGISAGTFLGVKVPEATAPRQ